MTVKHEIELIKTTLRCCRYLVIALSLGLGLVGCTLSSAKAQHDLRAIKDRQALSEFIQVVCAADWPDMSLV